MPFFQAIQAERHLYNAKKEDVPTAELPRPVYYAVVAHGKILLDRGGRGTIKAGWHYVGSRTHRRKAGLWLCVRLGHRQTDN